MRIKADFISKQQKVLDHPPLKLVALPLLLTQQFPNSLPLPFLLVVFDFVLLLHLFCHSLRFVELNQSMQLPRKSYFSGKILKNEIGFAGKNMRTCSRKCCFHGRSKTYREKFLKSFSVNWKYKKIWTKRKVQHF